MTPSQLIELDAKVKLTEDMRRLLLLEDGPCSHCGARDRQEAAYRCPVYGNPQRACHGEAP